MFTADWLDVVFVHFRVDRDRLQRLVPLELDLFEGRDAHVSLVAFTQANLRPTWGGRLGRLLVAPIGTHEFLNVRTYVRQGETRGIYFIAEWIPNRLAQFIGPRTYGLPYRWGRLSYNGAARVVQSGGRRLCIHRGMGAPPMRPRRPAAGAASCMGEAPKPRSELTNFLLERHTAFTHRAGVIRRFHVEHAPWRQTSIEVELSETELLRESGDWLGGAELIAAHHSPGVRDVRIGWPRVVSRTSGRATSRSRSRA